MKESTEGTATLLGDLLRGVVRRISDLQEAGHILQECGRLRRTAQDSKTLSSITRAFESAKSLNQRVETLKNCDETEVRGILRVYFCVFVVFFVVFCGFK